MSDTKQTFVGGCHCGNIRYSLAMSIPKDKPPVGHRCNCTVCNKTSFTSHRPESESDFTLIKPSSPDETGHYVYRQKTAKKHFCRDCGVHVWGKGKYTWEGTEYPYFSVNLATLDQPQEGLDLSEWKMEYYDGLHDNWMGGAKDAPWTGGLI